MLLVVFDSSNVRGYWYSWVLLIGKQAPPIGKWSRHSTEVFMTVSPFGE